MASRSPTYLCAIHILWQTEDIKMPAIMECLCMEVVEGKPGEFNWEVLDEPPLEKGDEMKELNALLTTWEPIKPSHQSKDKGKGKPTVEAVKRREVQSQVKWRVKIVDRNGRWRLWCTRRGDECTSTTGMQGPQVLVTLPQQHWAPWPYKQAMVDGACWWADG